MNRVLLAAVVACFLLFGGAVAEASSGKWFQIGGDVGEEEGYDFLARWHRPVIPLWVQTLQRGRSGWRHWYRLPDTFGGEIREFGEGPLSLFTTGLLAGAGSTKWVDREGNYYYQTADLDGADRAQLLFDYREDYWRVSFQAQYGPYIGYRFGGWNLSSVDKNTTRSEQSETTRKIVEDAGAVYIESGGHSFDIVFFFNLPMRVRGLGKVTLSYELPLYYALMGWAPLFDDADMEGQLYEFGGRPLMSATWDQRLGPLSVSVRGSIPTDWVVLPILWEGAELVVSAGLFF